MKKFGGMLLIALLGGVFSVGAYKYFETDKTKTIVIKEQVSTPAVNSSTSSAPSQHFDFTYAAEKTVNSVVHVFTEADMDNSNNPWADMFGMEYDSPSIQKGSGSGVIISKNGYIVTNNHVIDGADRITVSFNNNKQYEAVVIGTDPSTDIALIKVDATDLDPIEFGNSDQLKVGEWVVAVGNPFNLTSTVTAGIVSAKARDIDLLQPDFQNGLAPIESFIQTDAAVNPGNSGGALVNSMGQLIGINTAIASMTGSYSGYSFAVPVTIVQKVTKDLMDYGSVQRAFIGVRISNVTQEIAEGIGMLDISGVFVTESMENSAAAEAGIESSDVIKKVQGTSVKNVPELQEAVSRYRPGDAVALEVWRDGTLTNVELILRNKDGNTDLGSKTDDTTLKLGIEVSTIERELKERFDLHGGVQVDKIAPGVIEESGIESGFIITHIGSEKVYDTDDFERIMKSKTGGVLITGIDSSGEESFYALKLE